MPAPARLSLAEALTHLPAWAAVAGREAIQRSFVFSDFNTAWGFMSHVALWAERHDHHPEWFNVYNRVEVILTTHDAAGVSDKDIALARFMDALVDPA